MLPNPPDGLRHWRPDDASVLAEAWSDPDITRWNPAPPDLDPETWIDGVRSRWADRLALDLVIDDDGEVAGEVGLANFTVDPYRAELGVWVRADRRRQGWAATGVRSMTTFALASRGDGGLGLTQLWARSDTANGAASALFARLGWDRLGERDGRTVWSVTRAVLR